MILGTAAYMSPEQAKGKPVDRRADIFAFGCVLYELLIGKRAFRGDTITEILGAIIHKEPDWEALPGTTPSIIRSLLHRCLQKDLNRRLQHVGDGRIEIEEALTELTEVAPTPAAQDSPARRISFGLGMAGGVMVLVLLALALFWPFTATAPEGAIDSIAILPFENRSGDPKLGFVSDGIAEGIISRVSQLSNLNKVISSSSVRQYKGKAVDARTVAQEVDVRAVVMGNVTLQGATLRVYVELIDGESNSTLWGKTYTPTTIRSL